ncbi:photosystem II assembly protein Psb34 [[Limnothrix rosea] IAM M-220]|uniref:photosystem II assembly protein Psb34 n=1 Tax=[Limnothrix rosea] IAM M-220 TaxID=454133 RepID=UPI0011158994|nr:ssl1498 family light-harvesting-like protein [[Limnothrix rosea] IAM M-220]
MAYQIEDEDGKLNNFAVEPTMYKAEPKTGDAQKNTAIIGIIGAVLVVALIAVTFVISS